MNGTITTAITTAVTKLCAEAEIPAEQTELVIDAASLFQDEELQLRTAQMLVDAWKQDHATG